MLVTVESITYDGGTVAVGHGLGEEGQPVSFAGDWRPMRELALALDDGEDVTVYLEGWQILG